MSWRREMLKSFNMLRAGPQGRVAAAKWLEPEEREGAGDVAESDWLAQI